MLDTITPVTQQIAKLISSGVSEGEPLGRVARQLPELSPTELSMALQAGMAAAEAKAVRPQPDRAKGRALLAPWRRIKPRRH